MLSSYNSLCDVMTWLAKLLFIFLFFSTQGRSTGKYHMTVAMSHDSMKSHDEHGKVAHSLCSSCISNV